MAMPAVVTSGDAEIRHQVTSAILSNNKYDPILILH